MWHWNTSKLLVDLGVPLAHHIRNVFSMSHVVLSNFNNTIQCTHCYINISSRTFQYVEKCLFIQLPRCIQLTPSATSIITCHIVLIRMRNEHKNINVIRLCCEYIYFRNRHSALTTNIRNDVLQM